MAYDFFSAVAGGAGGGGGTGAGGAAWVSTIALLRNGFDVDGRGIALP